MPIDYKESMKEDSISPLLTMKDPISDPRAVDDENDDILDDDEADNDLFDEDDDEFVFRDSVHQLHEFEDFTTSLVNIGLLDSSNLLVDDDDNEEEEGNELVIGEEKKDGKDRERIQKKDDQDKDPSKTKSQKDTSTAAVTVDDKNPPTMVSLEEVLDQVDEMQFTLQQKGMRSSTYTFGLLDCLLSAYIFGSAPQHFWIWYTLNTAWWMYHKFTKMRIAKPLSEVFYYFDFCWVMNMLGLIITVIILPSLSLLSPGSDSTITDDDDTSVIAKIRYNLFCGVFGIAAGPVFLASMALPFVAFIFHDVNTMANLIIHVLPSIQMYCMRWHPTKLTESWPTMFDLRYVVTSSSPATETSLPFWDGIGNPSVGRNAILIYVAWWVCYVTWMVLLPNDLCGLKLPVTPIGASKKSTSSPAAREKEESSSQSKSTTSLMPTKMQQNQRQPKYDTVFHSLWRNGPCELVGSIVWHRPKSISKDQSNRNDFETRDFMLYMTGHAVACIGIGIGVIANICHHTQFGHAALILLSVTICANRGAHRYTFYTTTMYGMKLRKHFASMAASSEIATIHHQGNNKPELQASGSSKMVTQQQQVGYHPSRRRSKIMLELAKQNKKDKPVERTSTNRAHSSKLLSPTESKTKKDE